MEFGVNVPWFHGAYGHDLGKNQARPHWPVAFDIGKIEHLLDHLLHFDVRLIRVWLCEYGEGLVYSDGIVGGLDPTFLRNLEALTVALARREIRVYWTLLDANSAFRNGDDCTFGILTSEAKAERFCDRALERLLPLLTETAWAIDLCNEPEAIIRGPFGNKTRLGVSWQEVIPALRLLAARAKASAAPPRVSLGSGFSEHINARDNSTYIELCKELDFIDYHTYREGAEVIPRSSCLVEGTSNLPWILGEIGARIRSCDRHDRRAWEAGQRTLSGKLHRVAAMGYEAAFAWFASDPSTRDATSLFFADEPGRALYTLSELTGSLSSVGESTR